MAKANDLIPIYYCESCKEYFFGTGCPVCYRAYDLDDYSDDLDDRDFYNYYCQYCGGEVGDGWSNCECDEDDFN